MDKLLDKLYDKFFLRDVLSIFIAGFFILLSVHLLFIANIKDNTLVEEFKKLIDNISLKYFIYIFIIAISYLFGLIINILRDIISHIIYYKSFSYLDDYYTMKIKFNKISKEYPSFKSKNERLVIIFQTLGNLGFALLIISVLLIIKKECLFGILGVILCLFCLSLSYVIFRQHKIYNSTVIESL